VSWSLTDLDKQMDRRSVGDGPACRLAAAVDDGKLMFSSVLLAALVGGAPAPVRLTCEEVTTTGLGPWGEYKAESMNHHGRLAVVVTEKTIELMTSDHVASGVTEPDRLAVLAASPTDVVASRVSGTDVDLVAVNIESSAVLWTRVRPTGSKARPMQLTVVYACKTP
jgi:hypothetical protein